jgi:hypothetical protein
MAATCNVSESARSAAISRTTAYEWREVDPAFAKAWEDAEQQAADLLEKTAWDRATGPDKSDRMLEILLKAHRPNKFVEKRLLGSDPENPLPAAVSLDPSKLSTETLREIMAKPR